MDRLSGHVRSLRHQFSVLDRHIAHGRTVSDRDSGLCTGCLLNDGTHRFDDGTIYCGFLGPAGVVHSDNDLRCDGLCGRSVDANAARDEAAQTPGSL